MENEQTIQSPRQMSPLTLAFLGDAVFELLVRQHIVSSGSMPVGKLHAKAVEYVCATAQSQAMEILGQALTEREQEMFRRGRNANGNHIPRNANPKEYRAATGLETLFGYLYLNGETQRITELFSLIITRADQSQ